MNYFRLFVLGFFKFRLLLEAVFALVLFSFFSSFLFSTFFFLPQERGSRIVASIGKKKVYCKKCKKWYAYDEN